jgi:CII-binding regulator of phage lambda lysogenization HflD
VLNEEKKHNAYLLDKNKTISHELELSQALCQDTRMELMKAKDKFQEDQTAWVTEKEELGKSFEELQNQFEQYSDQQQDLLKNLSDVAEKKIIELKMAADKKANEAQGYYSHLQQQLNQVNVLKQENVALKEYIAKMTALPR